MDAVGNQGEKMFPFVFDSLFSISILFSCATSKEIEQKRAVAEAVANKIEGVFKKGLKK